MAGDRSWDPRPLSEGQPRNQKPLLEFDRIPLLGRVVLSSLRVGIMLYVSYQFLGPLSH